MSPAATRFRLAPVAYDHPAAMIVRAIHAEACACAALALVQHEALWSAIREAALTDAAGAAEASAALDALDANLRAWAALAFPPEHQPSTGRA